MKAHELARELGISQKELVNFLQQRRLTRNAAAPLAPPAIEAARSAFKPASVAVKIAPNGDRRVVLPPSLSVKDLAEKLSVSPVEVIKKLMASNIMATINQVIDFATAEIVADEFGYTVEPVLSEDVVATESPEGEAVVTSTPGLVVGDQVALASVGEVDAVGEGVADAHVGERRVHHRGRAPDTDHLVLEHRLVRVNLEYTRVVNMTREEIVGRTDFDLGLPDAKKYEGDDDEVVAHGRGRGHAEGRGVECRSV